MPNLIARPPSRRVALAHATLQALNAQASRIFALGFLDGQPVQRMAANALSDRYDDVRVERVLLIQHCIAARHEVALTSALVCRMDGEILSHLGNIQERELHEKLRTGVDKRRTDEGLPPLSGETRLSYLPETIQAESSPLLIRQGQTYSRLFKEFLADQEADMLSRGLGPLASPGHARRF